MRWFTCLVAACLLSAAALPAAAEELKSGLQPGDAAGAFNVVKCAGASDDGVAVGTELCYRCRYGAQPMVMVFTRNAGEATVKLVQELDEVVARHSDQRLKAFVNLLGEDREALDEAAKEVGEQSKAENVPVVVPVEFTNGPDNYGLNPEAETTVILVKKGKVVANHALAAGGLDESALKAIIDDVSQIVN